LNFIVAEVLALLTHFLSFILGLVVVSKHEKIFTRQETPKKCWYFVDSIEIIYFVVVLSLVTNIWFIYNQIGWMAGNYDQNLKDVVYLQWMWYHTGTGFSVCMLHLTIHWFLKKVRLQEIKRDKTNWKL